MGVFCIRILLCLHSITRSSPPSPLTNSFSVSLFFRTIHFARYNMLNEIHVLSPQIFRLWWFNGEVYLSTSIEISIQFNCIPIQTNVSWNVPCSVRHHESSAPRNNPTVVWICMTCGCVQCVRCLGLSYFAALKAISYHNDES